MIRTERKYIEILRILKEYQEPMGAKRLSEMMAERGFVLSDRAVQYYLSYLDEMGFTKKVGNQGRVLTAAGISETENALVGDRIGFVISHLERLAFRSTFDPGSGTGDVAYNLSIVHEDQMEGVVAACDEVKESGCGFFSSYRVIDHDTRLPPGYQGVMTICSITMDGVFQHSGIPSHMTYGGLIAVQARELGEFIDLIGYRGTTIDPLQLFISAGLTSIRSLVREGTGTGLANIRDIPLAARPVTEGIIRAMNDCGFIIPTPMNNLPIQQIGSPHRLSVVSYSGMNYVGNVIEHGFPIRTEIGAGTIPFARFGT